MQQFIENPAVKNFIQENNVTFYTERNNCLSLFRPAPINPDLWGYATVLNREDGVFFGEFIIWNFHELPKDAKAVQK